MGFIRKLLSGFVPLIVAVVAAVILHRAFMRSLSGRAKLASTPLAGLAWAAIGTLLFSQVHGDALGLAYLNTFFYLLVPIAQLIGGVLFHLIVLR